MGPLDKCADQPGTSCVDCARGHYEGYQYVRNPECEQGFTCEGSSSGVVGGANLSAQLARFALNIRSSRRHLFRQLSSDGPSGRALVAARSAALLA